MTAPTQPTQSDLLRLAQALAAFDVEYVVIGGAAMAQTDQVVLGGILMLHRVRPQWSDTNLSQISLQPSWNMRNPLLNV